MDAALNDAPRESRRVKRTVAVLALLAGVGLIALVAATDEPDPGFSKLGANIPS